ncbi:MAG: hypothetical protein JO247_08285 [Chloroflexi bacterium]|nr:hypothetical protein [Chloroflexota bacterium]
MPEWASRQRLKLKKNNRYFAKPGNKIFIANGGAVRFDYPERWIVEPGDNGSICFHDRKPPTHHAIIQMTPFEFLGQRQVDWSTLPLQQLFVDATRGPTSDPRTMLSSSELKELLRPGMEAVWRDYLMYDREDHKEVVSRQFMARGATVAVLFSCDYYADEAATFEPVWQDVVASLTLGQYIADPTTGF